MKLTQYRTTEAAGPSTLSGNLRRSISVQEIINTEHQLGMKSIPYCYEESKLSNKKDYRHINRVEVEDKDRKDRDAKLIEPIDQYMTPLTFEIEFVSGDDQYRCND